MSRTTVSGVITKGKQFQVRVTTSLGLSKKQVDVLLTFNSETDAHMAQELMSRGVVIVAEKVL